MADFTSRLANGINGGRSKNKAKETVDKIKAGRKKLVNKPTLLGQGLRGNGQ